MRTLDSRNGKTGSCLPEGNEKFSESDVHQHHKGRGSRRNVPPVVRLRIAASHGRLLQAGLNGDIVAIPDFAVGAGWSNGAYNGGA